MADGDGYFEMLALSFFALVGGVAAMVHGFRMRKQRNLIQETPTEDVESLSAGLSEVQGIARPHPEHGPITAPFSSDDCLVAEWKIEEYESDDDGGHWDTVASGVESVPFFVDDGTGKLLVDPHEDSVLDIDESEEPRIRVDSSESPSGQVREFLDREPSVGASGDSLLDVLNFGSAGDRRYYHHLLEPDEEVYAFGYVEPREGVSSPDNPENLVLRKTPEEDADLEPMFMISDKSQERLVEERKHAILWVPGGALISTLGLGGLVLLTHPVIAVLVLVVTGIGGGLAHVLGVDVIDLVFRTIGVFG